MLILLLFYICGVGATWLDFLPSLMNQDGSDIKEELKMDGTHMDPSYVKKYLEPALNVVV